MSSFSGSEKLRGNEKSHSRIFLNMVIWSLCSKGERPLRISKMSTPTAHQSTARV